MSEPIDHKVLRPMYGRSRGDWNPTIDDIADCDEDANYWAIFGVTRRGKWHCLGHFPTKEAAENALYGKNIRPVDPE